MKKTLIALTLAALPVASMADVILYGQIKAGVEVAQTKVTVGGKTTKDHATTEIADFGSRIGFKGSESLGSGLNAIWQVENDISVAGGGNWAGRDSFIGLDGNFGKVRAGRLSTQLNDMDTLDPWEYSNNALGLGVYTRTGERVVSVRYDTPNFAGFSANVQFTPRDNQNNTGRDDNGRSDTSAYYAGLNYENSGFFAQYGAGYSPSSYTTAPGANGGQSKSGQVHRLEGGYDANNLFVGVGVQYGKGWETANDYREVLGYDRLTTTDPITGEVTENVTNGVETTEAAITAAYRFGNVTPRVSYAHGWEAKVAGEKLAGTKYDQVVLGADYDFSKRTTAMVSAGWLRAGKSNDKTETTAGLVGVRHKF